MGLVTSRGRTSRVPALPYSRRAERGWDELWKTYHVREPRQLRSQEELQLPELPADRDDMIEKLYMGAPPEAIAGKIVLEVGSGSGFTGKRIAGFTELFIGIEWSGLALSVAKSTCPQRAVWIHVKDRREIAKHAGMVDTVLARHFMIHQRYERTEGLLRFDRALLKPGGAVYADFWFDDDGSLDNAGVFPARSVGERENSVYRYTDDEIAELARSTELEITDDVQRPDKNRRFVTFRKPL